MGARDLRRSLWEITLNAVVEATCSSRTGFQLAADL